MIEEDYVLTFSANECFVDLILSLDLTIYYGKENFNNSDSEGDCSSVWDNSPQDEEALPEEAYSSSQAGISTSMCDLSDGNADEDSEDDGCAESFDSTPLSLFD